MKKNVLVTGASGNLAEAFLEAVDFEKYTINATVREIKKQSDNINYHAVDINDVNNAQNFVENLLKSEDKVDAILFFVGSFAAGGIKETNKELLEKMMAVNVYTSLNIIHPVLQHQNTKLHPIQLIFIGAKAALNSKNAVDFVAYALSKNMVVNLATIINANSQETGVQAFTILPGTLDTATNRKMMSNENFDSWTKLESITNTIFNILEAKQEMNTIEL
ncbi:MAG: SDR family NAD(P)-dependent oxidoreductase [Cytophagales bacterium]